MAETKIIDNLSGKLTRTLTGDLNSGLAKFLTSFGYDPYTKPNNLTWCDTPVRIDASATTIQDLILHMKQRIESSIDYVYGIGYTGRLYKITTSTDTPTLVASTSLNLKYGGGMEFYTGGTEKIWIGTDAGLTKVGFDGSGQTNVGTFTANIPRPVVEFLGKLYIGNGNNIQEVDTTETISSAAKLNPALPANLQIQDIKVSGDGRYLKMLARRVAAVDVETIDPTNISSNQESYIFYWNGTDNGYTSYDVFPAFTGSSLYTYAGNEIAFGVDFIGSLFRAGGIGGPGEKPFTFQKSRPPLPDAITSTGDLMVWSCPFAGTSAQLLDLFSFGKLDNEVQGLFRLQRLTPSTQTDVVAIGSVKLVQNILFGTGGTQDTGAKFYITTFEKGSANASKLYKVPYSTTVTTAVGGVYETQTQMWQKKIKVAQARFYVESTVANNSFQMDLIDSKGNVISGSTFTYTFTTSQDMIQFNPAMTGEYGLALRITNLGSANMTFKKVELDLVEWGI